MTYSELYSKFKEKTGLNEDEHISDYRPCRTTYGVPDINNAIVVWLKGGDRVIFIADLYQEEQITQDLFEINKKVSRGDYSWLYE